MSSSEAYLDSLLDSILRGGKSEEEEGTASEDFQEAVAENKTTDGGKAMSPDEIEEMLVSMGTLGGGEEAQGQDMDSMPDLTDEHNTEAADSNQPDDLLLDDLSSDDLSLNDLDMGENEGSSDDFGMGDLSLDDLSLDDLSSEEPEMDSGASDAMGDLSQNDFDMGESGSDDFNMDDLSLDDLSLDDLSSEEPEMGSGASDAMGDLSQNDFDMGESGSNDFNMDDLSLDDLSLDDLSSEEPEMDSGVSGDLSQNDFDMGESGSDDFNMNDLSLDDLSLDDLSLEEPENISDDADDLMSEEDIDRLLNGDLSEGGADDFALEETAGGEDDDLSALLAGMGHDEDLSEINDLLVESDQNVTADDDMLAMLEGADEDGSFDLFESDAAAREAESIRELSPEEIAEREGGGQGKKKKKRKKLFGKKKKDSGGEEMPVGETEAQDELEALLGEVSVEPETKTPQGEKKPGFFARLLDFLLESDEEDEDPVAAEILAGNAGETGLVTDENRKLLQELSDEDKKGKKKKKKDKKGKKGKGDEEEDKKAAKPKKPKKVKKKKEKKGDEDADLLALPSKPLSKKKVITVFLFCATIAACIIVFTIILPETVQKQEAHTAYNQGDYAEVYQLLYGKDLNEQDEALFQGSNLILQMDRRLSSYDNYVNLDMRLEALDALIAGVERYYQVLPEAENYNVAAEVNDIYAQILERLSANFGLSEQDALDILALEDDETYSQRLNAIVNGELYDEEEEDETGIQDMLPEEEEIVDRLGGADGETELELEFAPEDISSEEEMLGEEMPEEQAGDESMDEGAD